MSTWEQRILRPGSATSRDIVLDCVWLLGLGLLLIASGIGLRDPWPADEPRFALIARDMVLTGDWLVPRVDGDIYADKPPLFFWLIALGLQASDSLRLAFLLPSLLSGQSQRRQELDRLRARRAQPARHGNGPVDRPQVGRRSRLHAVRVQRSAPLRQLGAGAGGICEQQRRLVAVVRSRATVLFARQPLVDGTDVTGRRAHSALVRPGQGRRRVRLASPARIGGVGLVARPRERLGATLERRRHFRSNAVQRSRRIRRAQPHARDRELIYPWLGFELVQDDFDRFSNHDQIGRTADFYLGTHLNAQLGYADPTYGADRSALIFSAKASHGSGSRDGSALLLNSAVGGRIESGELRNTVVDGAVRYYSKQSERRLFFTKLEASTGRALDLDTQVLLGGDTGLRGYPLRYQGGAARALLTVEQRYFTDWYPFRLFRVGAAAFVDVGRTWGESPGGTPSRGLLKDIGLGLRFGSSRSGLGNIIHVDLAFPLDGDSSIDDVQILVETKERF